MHWLLWRATIIGAAVIWAGNALAGQEVERLLSWSRANECLYAPSTYRILSATETSNCIMARIGAEGLDVHRARHESVVREIAWGQNRNSPVVLEFVWLSAGRGVLTVSDPSIANSSFIVPVPRSAWEDILARLSDLKASGAILHGGKAGPETNSPETFQKSNTICIDPRAAYVETTVDGSPVAAVDMDECYSDDFSFSEFLLKTAAGLAPECKRLQISAFGVSSDLLATCTRLSGDRTAAADAWNAAQDLAIEDFDGRRRTRRDFEEIIAEGATIRFDGAPAVRGRTAVAETFEKTIAGLPHFDLLSLTATATSDEVVIHGDMIGSTVRKVDRLDYDAPYTQIWRRTRSGKMLLVEWRIGKFTADES